MDTERAKMAAVSHGTSRVTCKQHCKYTTWVEILKMCLKKEEKKEATVAQTHMRQEASESDREWKIVNNHMNLNVLDSLMPYLLAVLKIV